MFNKQYKDNLYKIYKKCHHKELELENAGI